jgi:thiamine pyrophosphokinase
MAVDGGADMALNLELSPSLVIGDMDSIQRTTLAMFEAEGVELLRFPPTKDETDLELALMEAVRRDAQIIRILGGIGGRIDQTFGNIHLLQIGELVGLDVRLVAGDQTIWVVGPGEHELDGDIGDTISLLPLNEAVTDITTTGLEYPLQNETLEAGPARGMSNIIISNDASINFKSGKLLIVHTIGRA